MWERMRPLCLMTGLALLVSLSGCINPNPARQHHYKSSVVEYLYPQKEPVVVPSIPHLALPLRVGVAFVPDAKRRFGGGALTGEQKMALMERISREFQTLPFVKDIELIPSEYLTPEGGFTNLDQIRTMYGIDVIALLSFDQVQHTNEGMLSLAYWTIVGAYVIKGEKNETSTMMDAAVFDIPSRKMLFRAPGISRIKASATLVNLGEQLRKNSAEGFQQAADNLVVNLKGALARFKQKVKERPQEYAVAHRSGYRGGGALGGSFALLLLGLGGLALWRGKKEK
jgi:rhombotail lipoprotein